MGARLTAFENRSSFETMEIRVLNSSARPDQFLGVAKVRPGEVKEVVTKSLVHSYEDVNNYGDNPSLLMVLLGSQFVFLQPMEVLDGAKIICDIDDSGKFQLRIIKIRVPVLSRLRGFSFCFGRG